MNTTLIRTIPHELQRYDTAGDYRERDGVWYVNVSKMSDWRYEALVKVHEIVEMILCKNDGVDWKDIDNFDMVGAGKGHPDPGTLVDAPYYEQHKQATNIEQLLAEYLKVSWTDYNAALDALEYRPCQQP